MRSFAKKPKATQQTKATEPERIHSGKSRVMRSILHLQRTIGNQAVQRLLWSSEENGDESQTSASSRFGHDFSRIPVHAEERSTMSSKPDINFHGNVVNNTPEIHQIAQHGLSGNARPLPYLDQIQQSFGRHSLTGIEAFVGGSAREANEQMGSLAYTTAERVAFNGPPSLHTAAHEAAHIVQQRANMQFKSRIGQVGDRYEQHANAVADVVVKGYSAEPLLDAYTHSFSPSSSPQIQFQLAPTTAPRRTHTPERRDRMRLTSGTMSWSLMPRNNPSIRLGGSVDAHIRFTPNERLASEGLIITFIQTVFEYSAGQRDITIGTARVETLENETDPYYGAAWDPDAQEWRSEGAYSHPFTGSESSAELFDLAQILNGQGKRFETAAVVIVNDRPQVLASLLWSAEVQNYQTRVTVDGFREGVATREFSTALAEYYRSRQSD